jgi:hypothetical protein
MPFNAKKLRVALPSGEILGGGERKILPVALDLDAITDKVADCFAAVHPVVTGCADNTCYLEGFSDLYLPAVVSADTLPVLREALEAQLAEVEAAEQAMARRQAEG